jgi:AraC family transcriptional regulator
MIVYEKGNYAGSLLQQSRQGGLIASLTSYAVTDFNAERHYHDVPHLSFTLKGGLKEKKKEQYAILPGDINYYHAGEEHQLTLIGKPSLRINLELDTSFTSQFSFAEEIAERAIIKNPCAKFLMLKIYRELLVGDRSMHPAIDALLIRLLHQPVPHAAGKSLPAWAYRVREYLYEAKESVSLNSLAESAGVHPVTLSRYFPRHFGCSLGDYMRQVKVEKALVLLKSTQSPLSRIACDCGFYDQSHFIKVFKYYTGYSPAVYRLL